MKRMLIGCWLLALCGSGAAAEFPYGAELTRRYGIKATQVDSLTEPVEATVESGGMPLSDTVARLYATVADFSVAGGEAWDEGTNAIGNVQAALAIKLEGADLVWMGYSGGAWVPLKGITPEEGSWEVRVDIDYSPRPGGELIRYCVRHPGANNYTLLKRADGATWLPLGTVRKQVEQKLEGVRLYGFGEVSAVSASTGARPASGEVAVAKNCGSTGDGLVLTVSPADTWCLDEVSVTLTDGVSGNAHELTAQISDGGRVTLDFSQWVEFGSSYTYVTKTSGSRRGNDYLFESQPTEVLVGNRTDWFSYQDGSFVNARTVKIYIDSEKRFYAKEHKLSELGQVIPSTAAPVETMCVTIDAQLSVSGAVAEASLPTLMTDGTQGALTVVRYRADGARAWACRQADGSWRRLKGALATNGLHSVRMTVDYRAARRCVSYSVDQGAGYALLEDEDGNTAFSLPADSAVMTEAELLGGSVGLLDVACLVAPTAQWTGAAGDGDWWNAANWSPAEVPAGGMVRFTDDATLVGSVDFGAGGLSVDVADGKTVVFADSVTGTGSLIKSGQGRLVLRASNAPVGMLQVKDGALDLLAAIGSEGLTVVVDGSNAWLRLLTGALLPESATLDIRNGGRVYVNKAIKQTLVGLVIDGVARSRGVYSAANTTALFGEGRIKVGAARGLVLVISARSDGSHRLLLAGDSTLDCHGGDESTYGSWGWNTKKYLKDGNEILDYAKSGASTRSFLNGTTDDPVRRWDILTANIESGDYVYMAFGHNDMGSKPEKHQEIDEYQDALRQMVADVREKGGVPVIGTPICRNIWLEGDVYDQPTNKNPPKKLEDYADAAKAVAQEQGVDCIDMFNLTRDEYRRVGEGVIDNYFVAGDSVHPAPLGARRLAALFLDEIKRNNHPIAGLYK